jgi:thymidylate synthase (FAD)
MKPYAELLEFNQPNPVRKEGHTRIRDAFPGLRQAVTVTTGKTPSDGAFFANAERIVEFAGRWDYGEKNAKKLGEQGIIKRWIDMGHESMLEMADATFFIECSRVVSHEIARHRITSIQQESQRFVKYDNIDEADCFFVPEGEYSPDMEKFMSHALSMYKGLRGKGVPPQLARYVLPNGMGTRLVWKANLREWRHIVRLRTDTAAQPEMQQLAWQIHDQLVDIFPNVMYNAVTGERGVR